MINAPEGDGGFVSSGPQLHIVPATPVSGGGAASQAVPFQSTLETLHQGKFIDIITAISGTLLFLSFLRFTSVQVLLKTDHSNKRQHPNGTNNKFNRPTSPRMIKLHSFSLTATLLIGGCPLLVPKSILMVQIPTFFFRASPLVRVASLTLLPRIVPTFGIPLL